ncbi:MAG: hypothetical protein JO234_12535 [Hyphomicrobiales bacterium]|nr:hypothetical protein [Hyphomicrobiales bacterium]
MSSPAQIAVMEDEVEFLEALRSRYEAEGFTFTTSPSRSKLPAFLGGFTPDALAQRPGLSVAIAIKRSQSPTAQLQLRKIRNLFDGRPDWRFDAFFLGSGAPQSVRIPPAAPAAIRARVDEVHALMREGHRRSAFVMAWSLLEAAAQSADATMAGIPRTPGTVIQTLAMDGYIGADTEDRLRARIALRNQIVHGDVAAEPTEDDVSLLLSAIDETLGANAA